MASGYFPLVDPKASPQVAGLAAVYRRLHALRLDIEDGLARCKAILDPPLPPVLPGVHGTSMCHRLVA